MPVRGFMHRLGKVLRRHAISKVVWSCRPAVVSGNRGPHSARRGGRLDRMDTMKEEAPGVRRGISERFSMRKAPTKARSSTRHSSPGGCMPAHGCVFPRLRFHGSRRICEMAIASVYIDDRGSGVGSLNIFLQICRVIFSKIESTVNGPCCRVRSESGEVEWVCVIQPRCSYDGSGNSETGLLTVVRVKCNWTPIVGTWVWWWVWTESCRELIVWKVVLIDR